MTDVSLLEDHLDELGVPAALQFVVRHIGSAVMEISDVLRTAQMHKAGTANVFGDEQLRVDVESDRICFRHLRSSKHVRVASSEETVEERVLNESGEYSVGFDPLDGSSIVDANFAVGSIFGVWQSPRLVGVRCGDQVAAAIAIYGSRTTLCLALHDPATAILDTSVFTLHGHQWQLTDKHMAVAAKATTFAPGNLRATADNEPYMRLVQHYIANRYTLRYTGGMVPDVYHILVKGQGVFCNPPSERAPAKLRLLYEVGPVAMVFHCAGAASSDGSRSVLEMTVDSLDQRTGVCVGSADEVARFQSMLSQ